MRRLRRYMKRCADEDFRFGLLRVARNGSHVAIRARNVKFILSEAVYYMFNYADITFYNTGILDVPQYGKTYRISPYQSISNWIDVCIVGCTLYVTCMGVFCKYHLCNRTIRYKTRSAFNDRVAQNGPLTVCNDVSKWRELYTRRDDIIAEINANFLLNRSIIQCRNPVPEIQVQL